jgi:hypothetical protein
MWETVVVGMRYYHTQLNFTVDEKTEWNSDESDFIGYQIENEITLKREPNNEYDKNAIRVLMDGNMIGHIPTDDACEISSYMDSGYTVYLVERPFVLMEHNEFRKLSLRLDVGERSTEKVSEEKMETKREGPKEPPRHTSTGGHGLLGWIVKKLFRGDLMDRLH